MGTENGGQSDGQLRACPSTMRTGLEPAFAPRVSFLEATTLALGVRSGGYDGWRWLWWPPLLKAQPGGESILYNLVQSCYQRPRPRALQVYKQ